MNRTWSSGLATALCLSVVTAAPSGQQPPSGARSLAGALGINGRVTDRRGFPLPGVSVEALPEGGGLAMRATTDRDGAYYFEGLSEGSYRVDFSLGGFSGIRHNHVRPASSGSPRGDLALSLRPVCECITSGPAAGPVIISGQVVDEAGRPLPRARVTMTASNRHETAYADGEGRFRVRPPAGGTWSLGASDSGFAPVTQQVSTATATPLVIRLSFVGTRDLADTEGFDHECSCPQYFVFGER